MYTYINPHPSGQVKVRVSSLGKGARLDDFVQGSINMPYESYEEYSRSNYTANEPESWMAVDLGAHRRLIVDHYALRSHHLCTWELQGADSLGGPWTLLRRHQDDNSFGRFSGMGRYGRRTPIITAAAWPVVGATPWRCFRVVQNTCTHREETDGREKNHELVCYGIEMWGELYEGLHVLTALLKDKGLPTLAR